MIEHNLEVIKCADWVIDLGPEAGDEGGKIVAAGTPEEIARVAASHTGGFLRECSESGSAAQAVYPGADANGLALLPTGSRRSFAYAQDDSEEVARAAEARTAFRCEDGNNAIAFTVRASTISRISRSKFRATRW